MLEYRKANAKYMVSNVIRDVLGMDISHSSIKVNTHLYNECAIFNDNNTCGLYRGAIFFNIGANSKEMSIYYNFWFDTECEDFRVYAILQDNNGKKLGITF